jgi:hypothetical protein
MPTIKNQADIYNIYKMHELMNYKTDGFEMKILGDRPDIEKFTKHWNDAGYEVPDLYEMDAVAMEHPKLIFKFYMEDWDFTEIYEREYKNGKLVSSFRSYWKNYYIKGEGRESILFRLNELTGSLKVLEEHAFDVNHRQVSEKLYYE